MVFPSINESKQPFCVFCVPDASCFGSFFPTRIIMKFYYISRSPSTRLLLSGHKNIFVNLQGLLGLEIEKNIILCFRVSEASSEAYRPHASLRTRLSTLTRHFPLECTRNYRFNFSPLVVCPISGLDGVSVASPTKISCQLDDWPASTGPGS